MKQKVKFGKSTLQYEVIKSKRRKTSQITVDKDSIIVRTPISKRNLEIKQMVKEKSKWIYKKQLQFNTLAKLKVLNKKHSKQYLKRKVKFYAKKIGVQPKKIVIKKLKSRWGSAKDNTIHFNSNLLSSPKDVIDYVIVHELCHLRIRNHSFRFWNLLGRFMPLYRNQKLWLEMHGSKIL